MERVEGCGDYLEKGCVDIFNSKFVKLYTYNQNVERISEVSSMKKDLQSLQPLTFFYFCVQNCICLKVQWIPRELNTIAGQYSKYSTSMIDRQQTEFFIILVKFGNHLQLTSLLTVTTKSCIDLTRDFYIHCQVVLMRLIYI